MYNPRSKNKKQNSPFPFPSYVVKSYSAETPQLVKGLKINAQKIKKQFQSQGKLQGKHNKSESSQKIIKKNNHSTQALDQIYTLLYNNNFQPVVRSTEKEIRQIKHRISQNHSAKPQNYMNEMIMENVELYKEQIELTNQIQAAMNSLSLPNNRKNLYRTRQHKNTSLSPKKKLYVLKPEIIASFRHAQISLYNLLNRRDDYFNFLKNRPVQSLYPPLKNAQIEQLFKKYFETKGRDKGRVKFNYLTNQQLRSLKYKSNNNKGNFQTGTKKQKKQKVQDDGEQSQQQADGQQKPQLIDFPTWKRKNGVGLNQKVFIVKGGYAELRKTLTQKGWYENEDVWSPYFDFKWTTKIFDIDYMSLRPHQSVNHFNNNQHLTSKYGITRRLKTLYLSHQIDIDKFYPRCYDLADLVDFQNFIEDFKFGFAQTVSKRFIVDKKRYEKRELKVRLAYDILKRRNMNFRLLVNEINKGSIHFIRSDEWDILTEIVEFEQEAFQQKLRQIQKKQASQMNSEQYIKQQQEVKEQQQIIQNLQEKMVENQKHQETVNTQNLTQEEIAYKKIHNLMDEELKKIQKNYPQTTINGYRNVWIAKPNFLSRGRGIRCYNNLYDIITYCCGGTGQFVVQKYIENPLLIGGKKFDIRQWVHIQDYNPPKIWFYDECYVRFCADDYSLDNIHNRFQHLTNNSIQKYNKNLVVDKSMWQKSEFIAFVGKEAWEQIIEKIQNIVVWTIKSCEGFTNGRKGSCQLVGYDFMIDENLNPWLIEINMSPSMEYSTPVTKKLVKMVLQDTAKLIATTKKTNEIGLWKCIYKGEEDMKKFSKYKIT